MGMRLDVWVWVYTVNAFLISCTRGDAICPRSTPPPVGALEPRNVAVLFDAEYVPTLTVAAALRVKAALSKAAR